MTTVADSTPKGYSAEFNYVQTSLFKSYLHKPFEFEFAIGIGNQFGQLALALYLGRTSVSGRREVTA
jgi:hypothetical protein